MVRLCQCQYIYCKEKGINVNVVKVAQRVTKGSRKGRRCFPNRIKLPQLPPFYIPIV